MTSTSERQPDEGSSYKTTSLGLYAKDQKIIEQVINKALTGFKIRIGIGQALRLLIRQNSNPQFTKEQYLAITQEIEDLRAEGRKNSLRAKLSLTDDKAKHKKQHPKNA